MPASNGFIRSKIKDSVKFAQTLVKISGIKSQKPNAFNVDYNGNRFHGELMTAYNLISDPTKITFSYGPTVRAAKTIQNLTYSAVTTGIGGNLISIAYTTGAVAGAEVVSVIGNVISVQIESGVSTAAQIKTAIELVPAAVALVTIAVTGLGTTAQVAAVAANLISGLSPLNYELLLANIRIVQRIRSRKYVFKANILSIV
jgi:hypothetical protein